MELLSQNNGMACLHSKMNFQVADLKSALPQFRNDINGLRAWAVVAVVLYHFGIPGFGGGFVGVDVFFVISGYLMTSIIINGLARANGQFSVWKFYIARARRVAPALIVLCGVLLVFGWLALTATDYKALGTHILFTLLFLSNIKFWREAGYFDAASHEKWLLHTWSLSVEWQFYLLFPLVLMLLWKINSQRKFLEIMLIVGILISLALSIYITIKSPAAAFYLLPTRAWQMLAGGLVFFISERISITPKYLSFMDVSGFLLIMFSIFTFDSSTPWPGWRAIFPVFGSVLVLLAGQSASSLSNNSLAQWLGTRSYSVYLWHWPIVVSLFYLQKQRDLTFVAMGLALTVLICHYSYVLVEEPAKRYLGRCSTAKGVTCLFGIMAIVATMGFLVRLNNGVIQRLAENVQISDAESMNNNPRTNECLITAGDKFKSCIYGGNKIKAIVLGDSHANALITAIKDALPNESLGLISMSYSGCPSIRGAIRIDSSENKCHLFNEWAFQKIKEMPSSIPLIIINRATAQAVGGNEDDDDPSIKGRPLVYFTKKYSYAAPEFIKEFQNHLVETACEYAKGRTVYMLRPIPEMGINVPAIMARDIMFGRVPNIYVATEDYYKRNAFIRDAQDEASRRCGVRILDPLPFLCSDNKCNGVINNRPIYLDDDHLSEYGNKFLLPVFMPIFSYEN